MFLFGDRVYKFKKPVDLGFLDFGTPERRLAACRREVELNRRLAPDVYLGVAALSMTELVDGASPPDEPMVVMRRMPEDRRLSTLVRGGSDLAEDVDAIARLLAAFHTRASRSPAISAQGTRDALARRWEDSFAQVEAMPAIPLEPSVLAEIERLTRDFLAGRDPLLRSRIAAGRIVDGHGDLLADDIFLLDDGPRVLDCLEFDDTLRYVDCLDDVAFLAMDLERLGAPTLARSLLERYTEYTADPAPGGLWSHYVAYRAFVRAKVACVSHSQGNERAAEDAVSYADLALRHLRAGLPRLVLVGGLPGSGKSTVAGRLADEMGAVLIASDRVRKELAGIDPKTSAADRYRRGIYAPEHTARTYAELLARAEELLGLGESVVLDASWTDAAARDSARLVASRAHCSLVPLRCEAPTDLRARRLRARTESISDADPAIASAMAQDTDRWPEATAVDTSGDPDTALAEALQVVR